MGIWGGHQHLVHVHPFLPEVLGGPHLLGSSVNSYVLGAQSTALPVVGAQQILVE